MSQVTVTKCDVCGAIKGDANKWLSVSRHPNERGMYYPALWIAPTGRGGTKDVCSDTCLQKLVAEVVAEIRAMEKQ